MWQGPTLGGFQAELGHLAMCEPAPLHWHPHGPAWSCHGHPTSQEDPEAQGAEGSACLTWQRQDWKEHRATFSFPSHTMAGFVGVPATTILPGRPTAIWEGSVQHMPAEDLLLSVEYDEFLPHGL